MAQPVVSIYDRDNNVIFSNWTIENLVGQSESDVLDLLVWNNREGLTNVSDMTDVTIMVVDEDGVNENTPLVVGQWIHVLVNTTAETDPDGKKMFSPIGGSVYVRPLRAEGVDESEGNMIRGRANDGSILETNNFSKIKLKMAPLINAPGGFHIFKIKLVYSYT